MTIRLPSELVAAGLAPPDKLADLARVAARYAVAITPAIAALIDRNDPRDPIARQSCRHRGIDHDAGETADPIGTTRIRRSKASASWSDRVRIKLVNV